MSRPKNKEELVLLSNQLYLEMTNILEDTPIDVLERSFNFENVTTGKELHWKRDKNIRDVVTHLYEWHMLLIHWFNSNNSGVFTNFLPASYNWKNYGQLNIIFFNKHQDTLLTEAISLLKDSHKQSMDIINKLSNEELFTNGYYNWASTYAIGGFFVSCLSSHYLWALKKIKKHFKSLAI